MQGSRLFIGLGILVLVLGIGLTPGLAQTPEVQDFALFYEALAPYGKWIDYGKYGPVWFPTGVSEDWRPYLNGRWVPTEEGWVFETEEPWGWATYHYGNWFPTVEYGWVWSPGSTWYPSNAVWRTSDEYIGWAPLPPENYEPVPAFYPEGGYYPGAPLWDLLSPPFWTFCPTSRFLLGFGYPYAPIYSYWNCGCLAPFAWSPFLAFRTFFLPDFFFPSFAPNAFFAFGPPFPFIARVTNINIITINKFVRDTHFVDLKNVVPHRKILDRHPFIRRAIPDPVLKGQRFGITPVKDIKLAERNLLSPHVAPLPIGVPKVSQEIPKAIALPHRHRVGPQALEGVKGMALPDKAVSETATRVPAVRAPQPTTVAPPETRRGPARLETREDAGARMIQVLPPGRRERAPREKLQIPRVTPQPPASEETVRQRQQEQLRALERRQQRVREGQRQEGEILRQRQLRQQEVFRDQQRLLEQRQLRQQEAFRRQREQLQLQQQLERRQLQRQQQFRQEIRPPRGIEMRPQPRPQRSLPARPQFKSDQGGRAPSVRQMPLRQVQPRIQTPSGRSSGAIRSGGTGPRGRALGTSRGGTVRSSPGRSTRGGGRSFGPSQGMGIGRMGR